MKIFYFVNIKSATILIKEKGYIRDLPKKRKEKNGKKDGIIYIRKIIFKYVFLEN